MTVSEESDEALMSLYSKGDSDAFLELFSRYEHRLLGFFKRRLGHKSPSEAQDLFQMVWLKVHQARKSFKDDKRFSSWFFAIAMNTLRDFYRGEEITEEIDDSTLSVSSEIELKFELKRIEGVLPDLNDSQREILLLSDWEGFKAEEIAKMLDLKSATVRQILHRAREKVKEKLNEAG